MSSSDPSASLRHPIGVVARRTGLKPDLIRAWERRYGAVAPGRSDTRRRFYSDADVERLRLLRRAVDTGRAIGQVANLSNEELEGLIAAEPSAAPPPLPPAGGGTAESFLELCLAAARRLDTAELELHLEHASVALSRNSLLERLMVPLLHRLGDLWQRGELRPSQEHLVSAVARSFLGGMYRACDTSATAPHLLSTTPSRQRHEFGALIVAAVAAGEGWKATYLGPDLPPEEIAAAARERAARAVALSLVYPPDDPLLGDDLRRLRRLLPSTTALIFGGRAAPAYAAVLDEIGATRMTDLPSLRRELERLRAPDSIS